MKLINKIILFTFCISGSLLVSAQTNEKKETKTVWLTMGKMVRTGDSVIAFLSGASGIGLTTGLFVHAYLSHREPVPGISPERAIKEVGYGKIVVMDSIQAAVIKLYHPSDSLETGDVIALKLAVPYMEYRSVFSEMAFNDILYSSKSKESLYTLKKCIENDSKSTEDSIYHILLEDMHVVYEAVKNRTNLPAVMNVKADGGRFIGKTPLDVIRDVTRKDLESFLLYVTDYPAKYIGRNFRLSESFAGWLVSNSPPSSIEVKKGLLPIFRDQAGFLKRLPDYKKDILYESMERSFGEEAVGLSEKSDFKAAHEMADFAILLAYTLKDSANIASTLLSKAQVFMNEDKYEDALRNYEKAYMEAVMANEKGDMVEAMIKEGYCLFKISKYDAAEDRLNKAAGKLTGIQIILSGKTTMGDEDNLEKIYKYRSSISYQLGEYDKALKLLDTAISINNKINSHTANIKNAGYYKYKGQVLNEQGKPMDALDAFITSAEIYRNSSDVKNMALVGNEIAYSFYNQGDYRTSIDFCEKSAQILQLQDDDNDAGYSKSLMGSCYWELGKYDSAVSAHKASISLRKKSNNLPGQAFSWTKIGQLYRESGSRQASFQALDSALQIYKTLNDSSGFSDIYNIRGEVYLNDENYKQAISLFEKAKGYSSKATIKACYDMGEALFTVDTSGARRNFEHARLKSIENANINYQFYSALSLGLLAYHSGNIPAGNVYYDECISLSGQMGTASSRANCLNLKAFYFESNTELDSALYYHHLALVILDTVNKSGAVTQLNDIASVHISKGEFQKADETLTRAIDMARNIKDSIALGSTLQASSFLYSRTAEFNKGITNNDSAMVIFGRSGNPIRLANTLGSRGSLLSSMGDYRQSVNAYLKADSLYNDQMQGEQRGIMFNNIGEVYLNQADYEKAMQNFEKALTTMQKGVVSENVLLVKTNIAECLIGLNRSAEARTLLLEIFPLAQKLKLYRVASGMALVLGRIYFKENKTGEATGYLNYAKDFAIASGEKEKMINALVELGRVYVKDNKTDSAEYSLRKSVDLTGKYKIAAGWIPYYELALVFYNQSRFDSAIVYFKQAVENLDKDVTNLYGGEDARKIFNNDPRKSDLYNKITYSYFKSGDINQAWSFANRSNLAGIKELSGSLAVNSGDKEKNEALRSLFAMQESMKALAITSEKQEGTAKTATLKTIEILEINYNNFLQDVAKKYKELSPYLLGYNTKGFEKYKAKLDKDMALVLYLLNDKTLMIFTLTNEKLAVDTINIDIVPKIAGFIASIKNTEKQTGTGPLTLRADPSDEDNSGSAVEFKDLSDELYHTLISTVYDNIGSKKKLCIMPSGIFSNMPFQCLGKKMPGNEFRFLIEDYTVFYTNDLSVFDDKQGDTTNQFLHSFAAFGVPDAALHYNIEEVKNIGKIVGSDSTVYADGRATEGMAKKTLLNKKIIHFATHGILNYSEDYSLSYLKLLPDKDSSNGNNGKLTMREIQGLGIRDCNMVILSACQTAVSKELVTGWNISTANSFLASNVKTVVASLWKVADEPTELLMEYFYENLEKPMNKVDALRAAQIKLSQDKRFRHPNYWGAFVLYGDWR